MKLIVSLVLTLVFVLAGVHGRAEQLHAGFIKSVTGTVYLVQQGTRVPGAAGARIQDGVTLETGPDSTASIVFRDGTLLTLGEGSELEIVTYTFDPHTLSYDFFLSLHQGSIIYSSGKLGKLAPEKVNLKTPRAMVGVRGTRLLLAVD